jgi:hypothetical protein
MAARDRQLRLGMVMGVVAIGDHWGQERPADWSLPDRYHSHYRTICDSSNLKQEPDETAKIDSSHPDCCFVDDIERMSLGERQN